MNHGLDKLWQIIEARAGEDPDKSYTARLLARGLGRIAQKVGEEAVETAIEAVRFEAGTSSADKLAAESADLLYHLLVLWKVAGLKPDDVYAVLEARENQSGLEEKANRV